MSRRATPPLMLSACIGPRLFESGQSWRATPLRDDLANAGKKRRERNNVKKKKRQKNMAMRKITKVKSNM